MANLNSCIDYFGMHLLDSSICSKVVKTKNIVDDPDARKLQRVLAPVFRWTDYCFWCILGIMGFTVSGETFNLFPVFLSVFIILIISLMDDVISRSPKVRFVVEIVLVLFLINTTGYQLNNFHGLWGGRSNL